MTIQIPCLSCRRATPAGEDAASVSCSSCGTDLPPPTQAAWLMLRDGAQYGPYTIAHLSAWIADGRILPKDSVWYQGASVRLEVGQLPQLGEVAPARGDGPTPAADVELPAPYSVQINPDGGWTVAVTHRPDLSQPVFISHSLADSRFAAVFAQELSHHGLKAWYAERDADPRNDYWAQVDDAIRAAGAVVVVISPSLGQAPNVYAEVERTRRSGKPVFGLSICEHTGVGHGLGEIVMDVRAFGPEAGVQSFRLLFLLADIYGVPMNDARPSRFPLNLVYPGEHGKEPYYSPPPGPLPSYPAPPEMVQREDDEAPAPAVEQPASEPAPLETAAPEPAPVGPVVSEPTPVEPVASDMPAVAAPAPVPGDADRDDVEAQPGATVQIPCLSCRSATPAGENAAAVSCQSCGAALPPPAQAAWLMLRDGAQYGPYTIAQLAAYVAEGRILPKDSVWYPGAAVRLEVNQLPPFGEPAPASEGGPAPATAVDEPAPEPAPVEPAASDMPAAPAWAPASDTADWTSLEIQPGETSLGSWIVGLQTNWSDVAGSLTVTDRRILFKPKIAGMTLVGVLVSQTKQYKDEHTLVLSRDIVAGVHSKKRMLNTYIYVTTVYGETIGFVRGVVSSEPILAALQPR